MKIVDPDGKPVAGATITGVTASWPMTSVVPKDSTTVYALDPKAPRTLYVLHVEKKLGGTVKIRGDEKEAVTVKLALVGSIAGKLIDTDGRPIAGVTVGIQFPGGESANDLYRQIQLTQTPPKTDQDGLFRFDGILPSVKFYLTMTKGQEYFAGEPKIGPKEVKAGQILELGELKVKGRKFGE